MIKDHSDSEKGNPLPPHRRFLPDDCSDNRKPTVVTSWTSIPTDRIVHITAFVIPVVEHWLEQNTMFHFTFWY